MGDNEKPLFQSSSAGDAPPPRSRTPLFLAAGLGILVVAAVVHRALRDDTPVTPPVPVTAAPAMNAPSPAIDGVMVPVQGTAFKLGSLDADERPIIDARVDSFEIDTVEVSVDAYKICVAAGKCQLPGPGMYCNWDKPEKGRHPVNCVDAMEAEAYCAFVGKRLPSEDEWDYAARGGPMDESTHGKAGRRPRSSAGTARATTLAKATARGPALSEHSRPGPLRSARSTW